MTVLATPPTGPQLTQPRPGDESNPTPQPPPTPRIALRVGHAPRLPRRQRYVRVLRQLGRYALAEALIGWSLLWLVDVHFFVPGMVLAAMIGNPRRPKRPVRPAYAGSGSRAVHSLLLRNRASRAGLLSAQAPVRA